MPTYVFKSRMPRLVVKKYRYGLRRFDVIAKFDENCQFKTDNPRLFLVLKRKFPYEVIDGEDYSKINYNDLVTLAVERGIKAFSRNKQWIIKKLEEEDALSREKIEEKEVMKND